MVEPKRIWLLGASSPLAPALSRRLAAAGYAGLALSRTAPAEPLAPDFTWHAFDLADTAPWPGPFPEAVISCAPLWVSAPRVGELAANGVKRFVAFSSTSALVKAGSDDPEEVAIARRLVQAEALLARAAEACGAAWTVLRPTLIYGTGRDANISAAVAFHRRWGFFPVASPGTGLRQPVHVEDLAEAAVSGLTSPDAVNLTLVLPGGETLPYREMLARAIMTADMRPRLLGLPTGLLRSAFRLLGTRFSHRYSPALFARMNQDLAFDAAPAREALGYRPGLFRP